MLAVVDRRVCNRHHRLPHQKGELILDRRLGFTVQRGSRLVEKEDWRVLKQHPSDGDELTLAFKGVATKGCEGTKLWLRRHWRSNSRHLIRC
ncbi:hypothetical protein AJ88_25085 [Mesorhizobium amorphae CCBAU 01583]|nr:hypothetical protein AJ88_25085 [Mesorhizobium amorphae CCBAU 01583]